MKKPMNKKAILSAITALLIASGLGGYTIVKKSQFEKFKNVSSDVELLNVIDGDTIKVESRDFGVKKVRFIGIDTPEINECFGEEAKAELADVLNNEVLFLEKDISGVDVYDRLLRYVVLEKGELEDNVLVNEHMLRQGFAFYYSSTPNNRYRELFRRAEEEAKKAKRGMWGMCDYLSKEEDEKASKREKDSAPSDKDCIVKGNISEKGYGMTYLVPGCDNYNQVKIDVTKGERYFCSEDEALKAGFRKATNCP